MSLDLFPRGKVPIVCDPVTLNQACINCLTTKLAATKKIAAQHGGCEADIAKMEKELLQLQQAK